MGRRAGKGDEAEESEKGPAGIGLNIGWNATN